MKYILDTHTHTYASGHAYNTMNEMVMAAKEKGLELLCITDHGPAMPGSAHRMHFFNLRACPRNKYGIALNFGAEVNIVDYEGKVDLPDNILQQMDLCIASLHLPCLKPGSKDQNTDTYIQAMRNPNIHIIGHADDARYKVDYERFAKAAKEHCMIIEVNNSSLKPGSHRPGARDNYEKLLALCKAYEIPIALGSDAHIEEEVGNFTFADKILEEINFPKQLIANTSIQKFENFLDVRRKSC